LACLVAQTLDTAPKPTSPVESPNNRLLASEDRLYRWQCLLDSYSGETLGFAIIAEVHEVYGIVNVSVGKHSVRVRKAEAFQWDELIPQVEAIIEDQVKRHPKPRGRKQQGP